MFHKILLRRGTSATPQPAVCGEELSRCQTLRAVRQTTYCANWRQAAIALYAKTDHYARGTLAHEEEVSRFLSGPMEITQFLRFAFVSQAGAHWQMKVEGLSVRHKAGIVKRVPFAGKTILTKDRRKITFIALGRLRQCEAVVYRE
jgi:hypothetical protein